MKVNWLDHGTKDFVSLKPDVNNIGNYYCPYRVTYSKDGSDRWTVCLPFTQSIEYADFTFNPEVDYPIFSKTSWELPEVGGKLKIKCESYTAWASHIAGLEHVDKCEKLSTLGEFCSIKGTSWGILKFEYKKRPYVYFRSRLVPKASRNWEKHIWSHENRIIVGKDDFSIIKETKWDCPSMQVLARLCYRVYNTLSRDFFTFNWMSNLSKECEQIFVKNDYWSNRDVLQQLLINKVKK